MSTIKQSGRWLAGRAGLQPRAVPTALNSLILLLWLWLYSPLFAYLTIIFSREDFRTNQLVLVSVLILVALQIHGGQFRLNFTAPPHFYRPAVALALGGSVLFVLAERFLNINTLSASIFALASYGLLGLWLEPQRWRPGLPAALLLAGALPFGDHLQTFVGYPMRIVTAGLIHDGLAAVGITSVGVDTILVFENGVSQVDLPCSGVKSLWTGLLFLLAATWLERRVLNWRWLLVALALVGLLFVTNLARVAILITVGEVAGWRLAAQMLHVPLGVLGFIAACAAALGLLRWGVPLLPTTPESDAKLHRPAWLAPTLALSIAALALLYTPRPHSGLSQPAPGWSFPAGLVVTPLPLSPTELDWFIRDGADAADRYRFEWRDVSGSMILVTSRTWRAHHRPERCFEVYGLSLEESRPYLAAAGFPLRLVSLGDGEAHHLYSAGYWFQSASRTTDDYATRIWADLSPQRERWVLVSILFDNARAPADPALQTLVTALHQAVAQQLSGEKS